ncbi:MAG: biotin carboxylase N-terminal domain-containing protein [Candidatus Eisenbacteria bacterium]
MPSFHTVLIANRGEIAVRVARTLRTRGQHSIALFHAVDRDALHVAACDRAVELTGDDPRAAYLDVEQVVAAAKSAGAQAIHPGYGFLSEQGRFARAVEAAGLVFIGPRPETLETVGDKRSARAAARAAGLPVAPGWEGDPLDAAGRPTAEAIAAAKKLGFPLLLKAVSGGGGKGMRTIDDAGALAEGLAGTAREALASFGNAAVYLERRLEPVRHVEVQFLGDGEGGAWHLLERECSLQRRHQKVIEESPGARVDAALRKRLTDATKALAREVRYRGVGTAEFLVDEAGEPHFLEVNARIQVEHPVTELVTGRDLVGLQLDIAAGLGLPGDLEPAAPHGHAVEARLYAEDPAHDFLPQSGPIAFLRLPAGPFVRVDAGVRAGDAIGLHFDPMIAKITTWGPDRASAYARLRVALEETEVAGVVTNLAFLRVLVAHPDVLAGETTTTQIERAIAPAWRKARVAGADDALLAAAALAALEGTVARGGGATPGADAGPWSTLAGFRLGEEG